MLKYTNFKQITVGNLGLEDPPPELYVPIISSFLVGILTDPLPPGRDNVTIIVVFFLKASLSQPHLGLLQVHLTECCSRQ